MSKHKTTSKNLSDKIDANNAMVKKSTVLEVDANAIDFTLCCEPVPINHSSQSQFFKSASSVKLAKPVHIQVTHRKGLWAFKLAEQDWSFRSCDGIDQLFHCMFQNDTSEKDDIQGCLMLFVMILVLQF